MQMYHACVKGEVENVRQLLEGQPYLLQQDLQIQLGTKEDGTPSFVYWTALTAASSCGQTQVVEVLLGAGAKVNQVDRTGMTALRCASQAGHTDVIRLLLSAGANVDQTTENQGDGEERTALMDASSYGLTDIIQLLLSAGANVNQKTKKETRGFFSFFSSFTEGWTAFDFAWEGKKTDAQKLLLSAGANVDPRRCCNLTGLMIASKNGWEDAVQGQLSVGEQINKQNQDGLSALMCASQQGHSNVISLLLSMGAKVNEQDKRGDSPFDCAWVNKKTDAQKLLLSAGAQVRPQKCDNLTGLMIASRNGWEDAVQAQFSVGENVNQQNKDGMTALIYASSNDHTNVVPLLLSAGANANQQDKDEMTSLMHASRNGYPDVVQLLLSAGVNVNQQDQDGMTALMYASQKGHIELIPLLLSHEANVNPQNKTGRTALGLTSSNEIARLLKNHSPLPSALSSSCCVSSSSHAAQQDDLKKQIEEPSQTPFAFENLKQQMEIDLKKQIDHFLSQTSSYTFETLKQHMETEMRKLENQLEQTKDEIETLKLKHQVEKIKMENQLKQGNDEINALKSQLRQKDDQINQISNEKEALEEENVRLQSEILSLKQKPFNETKYYHLYKTTEPPRFTFDVFTAVKTLIETHALQHCGSVTDEEVNLFIGSLHRETNLLGSTEEMNGGVENIAVRLWTSPQKLKNREFCSIFNEAIRNDNQIMMPAVVLFAQCLNMLCVTRGLPSDVRWPGKTFRGGGLPEQHHHFFKVGKRFRTPQFLSTSRIQRVAFDFTHKAADRGEEPVLWEFVFDEVFGCKHVNFLERSNVEGEDEFLFTAYSVFTVRSIEIKNQPKWNDPHKVVLEVAPDNRDFPEDLPVSPWC